MFRSHFSSNHSEMFKRNLVLANGFVAVVLNLRFRLTTHFIDATQCKQLQFQCSFTPLMRRASCLSMQTFSTLHFSSVSVVRCSARLLKRAVCEVTKGNEAPHGSVGCLRRHGQILCFHPLRSMCNAGGLAGSRGKTFLQEGVSTGPKRLFSGDPSKA